MEVAAYLVGKATKVVCVSSDPTPFVKTLGVDIGNMVLKVCVCVCVGGCVGGWVQVCACVGACDDINSWTVT